MGLQGFPLRLLADGVESNSPEIPTTVAPADLELFLGAEAIRSALAIAEGVTVPLDEIPGAQVELESIEPWFRDGDAGLSARILVSVEGQGVSSSEEFRVEGRLVISEDPETISLGLRLLEVMPAGDGAENGGSLVLALLRAVLPKLNDRFPVKAIQRRHELPIDLTPKKALAVDVPTGSGRLHGQVTLPVIKTTVPVRLEQILAAPEGIYLAASLQLPDSNSSRNEPQKPFPGPGSNGSVQVRLAASFFDKVVGHLAPLLSQAPPATLVSTRKEGQLVRGSESPCEYLVELDDHADLSARLAVREVGGGWSGEALTLGFQGRLTAKAKLHWHVKCLIGGGIGDRLRVSPAVDQRFRLALRFDSSGPIPRYRLDLDTPDQLRLTERIEIPYIADVPVVLPISLPKILAEGEVPSFSHAGVLDLGAGRSRPYSVHLSPTAADAGHHGLDLSFQLDTRIAALVGEIER